LARRKFKIIKSYETVGGTIVYLALEGGRDTIPTEGYKNMV